MSENGEIKRQLRGTWPVSETGISGDPAFRIIRTDPKTEIVEIAGVPCLVGLKVYRYCVTSASYPLMNISAETLPQAREKAAEYIRMRRLERGVAV